MTVSLVTGAGGFVAGHLCRHLTQRGAEIRRVSSHPRIASWRKLRLLETRELKIAAALEGVEQVYFLAGVAHEAVAAGDRELMRRVNVEAPLHWLRAADLAGVRRFVWLSSIKVLGDASERPLEPDDPYRPADDYARSKVEAEQRLLDEPLGTTSLAVVRPPLVYGPGVRGNFASLLRVAASSLPLPVHNATAPRSMAAADNLCDLLLRLGAGGGTNEDEHGIFHVADREDTTVCGLVADIRRLLGRPQRQFALPRAWLRGAAHLTGHESVYQRLFEPLRVDTEATRSRLGWSAPHSSAEALRETVAWFRTSR